MRTAIDTNILSALWSKTPVAPQVAAILGQARADGGLVICGAVYAELLAHPNATEDFVRIFLDRTGIISDFGSDELTWRSTGAAYAAYAARRRSSAGGEAKRMLADFMVGAHAAAKADRLMTLDPARYVTAYPKLLIIPKPGTLHNGH